MKRKTILFGSIFAIFLMLMIPNVGAIEFNTVKNVFEEKKSIINSLENIEIELLIKLKELIQNSSSILIITLLNILAFILSVVVGTLIISIFDSPLIGLISAYISIIPLWLVLMIAKKITTTDLEWTIAFLEYLICCFLLGVVLGAIEKKINGN